MKPRVSAATAKRTPKKFSSLSERKAFAKLPLNERLESVKELVYACLKRVPKADLEDVFQDAMLRLVSVDKQYRYRKAKYSTWVTWQMLHVLENYRRRSSKHNCVCSMNEMRNEYGDEFQHADKVREAGDIVADADAREHQVAFVKMALSKIHARDREVIERRFALNGYAGQSTVMHRIGAAMGGIVKERVRQLETRALKSLRSIANARGFEL